MRKRPKEMATLSHGHRQLNLAAIVVERSTELAPDTSQEQMCRQFDVTDRTLRNWASRGMPVKDGAHNRPVHPPDAFAWAIQFTLMVKRDGQGPVHLSMDRVRNLDVEMQAAIWPEDFVLVPLDWDHPIRAHMLVKAAAGIAPPEVTDS
jgi:hypothetical protein